eukprot:TRINITY_DN1501_c1_g1_i1.p1 TRINITY_DN1501_c1_g1~~TRINITY_DN1501_c1_g1_i1.p1  ORF type:complete len:399 (+),score=48.87 TRINITY_DN1501_c1_g1_i1:44-1240(+)
MLEAARQVTNSSLSDEAFCSAVQKCASQGKRWFVSPTDGDETIDWIYQEGDKEVFVSVGKKGKLFSKKATAEGTVDYPLVKGGIRVVVGEQPGNTTPSKEARYNSFISKMKDVGASPLVKAIKKFISEISTVDTETAATPAFQKSLPARVTDFLQLIHQELTKNPLWEGASQDELAHASEGMEKYVLCKVYPYTFGKRADLVAKDKLLQKKISMFQTCPSAFQKPQLTNHPRWEEAIGHLNAVNEYKSPFDKLICLTNCNKILSVITKGKDPTECLPQLLYSAKVDLLLSNIFYVLNYRQKDTDEYEFLQALLEAQQTWAEYSPQDAVDPKSTESVAQTISTILQDATPGEPVDFSIKAEDLPLSSIPQLIKQITTLRTMEVNLRKLVGFDPHSPVLQ